MRIFIFLFFLLPIYGYSQQEILNNETTLPVDPTTNRVSYSEIISIPNAKARVLYPKAKEWFIKTYNSGKDVIQLDDAANGKIIGKGFSTFQIEFKGIKINYEMWYLLTIAVKDGKYKYTITDFNLIEKLGDTEPEKRPLETALNVLEKNSQGIPEGKKMFEDEKFIINQKVITLTSSLKSQMVLKDDF